jgi:hypothetical protein
MQHRFMQYSSTAVASQLHYLHQTLPYRVSSLLSCPSAIQQLRLMSSSESPDAVAVSGRTLGAAAVGAGSTSGALLVGVVCQQQLNVDSETRRLDAIR